MCGSGEQVLVFPLAGLNEAALFSCEAHNSKGLTASSPGQVNVKGKRKRDTHFYLLATCVQAGDFLVSALPSTHLCCELKEMFLGLPYLFFLGLNLYVKSSGMHIVARSPNAVLSSQYRCCGRTHQQSTFESRTVSPSAGFGRAVSLFSFLHNQGGAHNFPQEMVKILDIPDGSHSGNVWKVFPKIRH